MWCNVMTAECVLSPCSVLLAEEVLRGAGTIMAYLSSRAVCEVYCRIYINSTLLVQISSIKLLDQGYPFALP